MPLTHPTKPMGYVDALEYMDGWLAQYVLAEDALARGYTARVYDYFDRDPEMLTERPWVGVRVSEVSFSNASGGWSYMQPEGLEVIGQVERCVIALIEGWNDDPHMNSDGTVWGETDQEFLQLEDMFKEHAPS